MVLSLAERALKLNFCVTHRYLLQDELNSAWLYSLLSDYCPIVALIMV